MNSKGGFMKGMGTGVIVGAVAGMTAVVMMKKKNSVKNKMGKTIKNVGEVVDNVFSMFS